MSEDRQETYWVDPNARKLSPAEQLRMNYIEKEDEVLIRQLVENGTPVDNILEALKIIKSRREDAFTNGIDHLTGLPLRRIGVAKLKDEIVRKKSNPNPPSLFVMLDVDHFKMLNDTYGHDVGDLVLAEFAHNLHEVVRENDTAIRWGGEEFALIFQDVDPKDFPGILRRLGDSLYADDLLAKYEVTFSAGVSRIKPGKRGDFTDIVRRSDMALYRSKRNGRNRCYQVLPNRGNEFIFVPVIDQIIKYSTHD